MRKIEDDRLLYNSSQYRYFVIKMNKTRHNRCHESIKQFFEHSDNIGLETNFKIEKMEEKGWKTGKYMVTIPNKWIEKKPHYEGGNIRWENLEFNQTIPTIERANEIAQNFKTIFEPFEHKVESVARIPRITSFVRIYQSELEHDVDTGIETHVFRIMVLFNKQEIPFPENQTRNMEEVNNKLMRENRYLHNRFNKYIRELGKREVYLQRKLRRTHDELTLAQDTLTASHASFRESNDKYFHSYRNIINDLYTETKKEFECPVCYETIKNEEAFTTPCNHVICNDCSGKCRNNCPMCRQEMCCL